MWGGNGLDVPAEPDIRVHLSMIVCIKNILGEELQLNPYEELFSIKKTAQEKAV